MRERLFTVFVGGVLSAVAPAQAGPPATVDAEANLPANPPVRPPLVRVPIHSAPADEGQDYGLWCAGDGYKASFHGGMTFVPYLGHDYPHNQPLAWRTIGVRFGVAELLPAGARPEPVPVGEYRCEYRLGSGITEAYDVRSDGLEQTFVIAELPGGSAGDLIVRGAVTSKLRTKNVAAAHQALTFVDATGRPIVEYGAGVAFDAAGRRVDVLTAHDDGEVTLTVPGGWLEAAELPIVIDPLFGPFGIPQGTATSVIGAVDLAIDAESLAWPNLYVHTRAASATDEDLYAHLYDGGYQNVALVFSDITASWTTDAPSCAFVGGADRWVIAMRRLFASGSSRVRVRVHDSGSTTASATVAFLTPPAGHNDWRPDVGGVQANDDGHQALVVCQREDNTLQGGVLANSAFSAIHGVVLDATTPAGTFGAQFAIADSPITDFERPAVNRVARGPAAQPSSWVVAYQSYRAIGSSRWNVVGRRVDSAGSVASGVFASAIGSSGRHQLAPVVEGTGGRYAVAFASSTAAGKPSGPDGSEIHLERFDWPDSAPAPTVTRPPVQLDAGLSSKRAVTGLAHDTNDASHWCTLWRYADVTGESVSWAYTGFNGQVTESGTVWQFGPFHRTPAAACFSRNGDVYVFAAPTNEFNGNQVWGCYGLYWSLPSPSTAGLGCSTATIDWAGTQQIGAEFCGVQVGNSTLTAGHFLLVAIATQDVPVTVAWVAPGCRLLVDNGGGFLGTMPFQFGMRPFWQFPLPEFLDPGDLYFQDWVIDNNQFTSTQRLRVPIIK